jgi:hypothetical protein
VAHGKIKWWGIRFPFKAGEFLIRMINYYRVSAVNEQMKRVNQQGVINLGKK